MPKMAKKIERTRNTIKIDGEEFPFYVAENVEVVGGSRDNVVGLRVTILADEIELSGVKYYG